METTTQKVSASGNGTATSFSFSPLVIFQSSDLVVTKVASDGTETTLAETTDYTVVPTGSYPSTGSITYPASGSTKLATGESLVMKRVLPIEQTTDLENQGGYFPDTQETALDKLTMIDLQQQEDIDRSLKIPVSDSSSLLVTLPAAADRAGKGLVFDSDGNPAAGSLSSVAVSSVMTPVVQASTLATAREDFTTAFIATLLDDTSASGARTTLGAAASAQQVKAGTGLSGGGTLAADRTISLDPAFLRGYIAGLTLSNDATTPNTKLDVAPGVAVDSTTAVLMQSDALVINCGATGANGLDTGSLAASTWYHVFLIAKADGTAAALASTSASAPTMPTGYSYKRRIGSFKTDSSSHILAFTQTGDEFLWSTSISEASGLSVGTAAVTVTLVGVPPVVCEALLRARLHNGSSGANALISSTFETDQAPSSTVLSLTGNGTGGVGSGEFRKRIDTDQSLRVRSDVASSQLDISSYGFIDTRGRFA